MQKERTPANAALAFNRVILAFAVQMSVLILCVLSKNLPPLITFTLGLLAVAAGIWYLACVLQLGHQLGIRLLYLIPVLIALFIPYVNLVVFLVIFTKGKKFLREQHYLIGFLGARPDPEDLNAKAF